MALLCVGAVALAGLLTTSTAIASSDRFACSYKEAGSPGPKDNYLVVRTTGWPVILKRDRNEIRVEAGGTAHDITHYPKFSDRLPVTCEGTQATVTNIDQINRRLTLSIKALEVEDEKQAMAEFGSSDSGASLGDILGAAIRQKQEAGKSQPE